MNRLRAIASVLIAGAAFLALVQAAWRIRASFVPTLKPVANEAVEVVNPRDGSILVLIPAGGFLRGEEKAGRTWPLESITLPAFFMSRVEVTNAQYRRFAEATGRTAEADEHGKTWADYAEMWGDRAPVVSVSLEDADAYACWAGMRLPTEDEWEKAARGVDGRPYPWGREKREESSRDEGPADVGSRPYDVSPYGCLDMGSDILEWTSSRMSYHGSVGQNYPALILRGGPTSERHPVICTLAVRSEKWGLRCATDVEP